MREVWTTKQSEPSHQASTDTRARKRSVNKQLEFSRCKLRRGVPLNKNSRPIRRTLSESEVFAGEPSQLTDIVFHDCEDTESGPVTRSRKRTLHPPLDFSRVKLKRSVSLDSVRPKDTNLVYTDNQELVPEQPLSASTPFGSQLQVESDNPDHLSGIEDREDLDWDPFSPNLTYRNIQSIVDSVFEDALDITERGQDDNLPGSLPSASTSTHNISVGSLSNLSTMAQKDPRELMLECDNAHTLDEDCEIYIADFFSQTHDFLNSQSKEIDFAVRRLGDNLNYFRRYPTPEFTPQDMEAGKALRKRLMEKSLAIQAHLSKSANSEKTSEYLASVIEQMEIPRPAVNGQQSAGSSNDNDQNGKVVEMERVRRATTWRSTPSDPASKVHQLTPHTEGHVFCHEFLC